MNLDDPRLTACALDELPQAERAALDAEMQASPELRAELDEIRRVAGMLSDEFAAEPCPKLSTEQREAIATVGGPKKIIPFPEHRIFRTAALTALAACIAVVLTWQFWFAHPAKRLATLTGHEPFIVSNGPLPFPVVLNGPTMTTTKDLSGLIKDSQATTKTPPPAPASGGVLTVSPIANPPSINGDDLARLQDQVKLSLDSSRNGFAKNMPNSGAATPSVVLQNGLRQASSEAPVTANLNFAENEVGKTTKDALLLSDNLGLGGNSLDKKGSQASAASSTPALGVLNADGSVRQIYKQHFQTGQTVVVVEPRDAWPRRGPIHPRYIYVGTQDNTASYPHYLENTFQDVLQEPLSTFSADVDGASYANVRRFLDSNQMPPRDAVRIEEMVNYFSYDYPQPHGEDPFSVNMEVAGCPWNADHRLVRIGIKGRDVAPAKRAPGNFVFLIDVSGSMEPPERLPLIKQALRHLVKNLNADDRVAIVVYASEAGVKLPSTPCSEKEKILEAIDSLTADGSTNGGDGIQQAYRVAKENFINGGINRVLLCTDGDFNVGITNPDELTRMIEDKAKSGVFLTTLGVGTDNYKDALMQKLADKGNGNYYYLDSLEEAERVLIDQMNGTLVTIAKDVKMQVEFNPAQVSAYRLIGYEKRALAKQDFNNDAKDAGEIGAGHTVTALYEIVPAGRDYPGGVDDLKYQPTPKPERHPDGASRELLTLKLRYKQPDGDRSHLISLPLVDSGVEFSRASTDFKFAAAVASFGMLLQDSEFKGDATYGGVEELARSAKGDDKSGNRSEFINLVRKVESLR